MNSAKLHTQVIPGAGRLTQSLRDLGYNFNTAVADLVDNCIGAHAVNIQLSFIDHLTSNPKFLIIDDGIGMPLHILKEAMRYGSERKYSLDDLGKYGLGLKTASMSQCQKLTVATRSKRDNRINAFCWDLKHVTDTNRWEIIEVNPKLLPQTIRDALNKSTGTAVIWENLDRVLDQAESGGEQVVKRISKISDELEEFLAMTFHRFMDGQCRKKIKLKINGNTIHPWDPFVQHEKGCRRLPSIEIECVENGVSGTVRLSPFVLPNKYCFSSDAAFNRARGPKKWLQQQGFYIYRLNRLIQSGGWCRLRAFDDHMKLSRIALDYPRPLDEAFKINVAKMQVQIPSGLREKIKKAIEPAIKAADQEYRKETERTSLKGRPLLAIGSKQAKDLLKPVFTELINTASPKERPVVKKAIKNYLKQNKINMRLRTL